MIVCMYHRVSGRDIANAVRQGCTSFDDLQEGLRVATACGACDDCSRQTFDLHRAQEPCARMSACANVGLALTSSVTSPAPQRANVL